MSSGEHVLARFDPRRREAVVNLVGRQQADAGVAVLVVYQRDGSPNTEG